MNEDDIKEPEVAPSEPSTEEEPQEQSPEPTEPMIPKSRFDEATGKLRDEISQLNERLDGLTPKQQAEEVAQMSQETMTPEAKQALDLIKSQLLDPALKKIELKQELSDFRQEVGKEEFEKYGDAIQTKLKANPNMSYRDAYWIVKGPELAKQPVKPTQTKTESQGKEATPSVAEMIKDKSVPLEEIDKILDSQGLIKH